MTEMLSLEWDEERKMDHDTQCTIALSPKNG